MSRRCERPRNTGSAASAPGEVGRGHGGVDDRRVGEHPAGGDVAFGGEPVAGLPQRAHGGERPRLADLVDARRAPPRLGPRRGRPGRAHRLELLAGPLQLALLGQQLREDVAQLHQHLDVQRGVDEPVVGQRAARPVGGAVALLQREPEQLLDQRAQPDAGEPGEPPGQLGVEQRAPGASPTSARQGRSWDAACSTHSGPVSAGASSRRSLPSGIGSTSAVPAPARRSCTRYARWEYRKPDARSASTATGPVPAAKLLRHARPARHGRPRPAAARRPGRAGGPVPGSGAGAGVGRGSAVSG